MGFKYFKLLLCFYFPEIKCIAALLICYMPSCSEVIELKKVKLGLEGCLVFAIFQMLHSHTTLLVMI